MSERPPESDLPSATPDAAATAHPPDEAAGGESAASPSSAAPPAPEGEPSPGNGAAPDQAAPGGEAEPQASDEVEPAASADQVPSQPVQGKVIGWNRGGFHVVVGDQTAFCPRSEMEIGNCKSPKSYLDRSFDFQVLRLEDSGRRVVLSRAKALRGQRRRERRKLVGKLEKGSVVEGRVISLTDFGAFVDLGGVQGLVHVSELSHERVGHPSEALEVGQKVEVQVLKVEKGGKRISLSRKALEPDPWREVKSKFEVGAVVKGKIEKVQPFGAFVALEPGLTGLLASSQVDLPRGSSLARMYPPGKEVAVQILKIDPRRRRIALALEGSGMEGTRADYVSYQRGQSRGGEGFKPLAAALEKLQKRAD